MQRIDDRLPGCLRAADDAAWPLHAVRPAGLDAWLGLLPRSGLDFVRASGFAAEAGRVLLLPGSFLPGGQPGACAVFGLGDVPMDPHVFGSLATALPPGTVWRLASGFDDPAAATLGFCLGAYRFDTLRKTGRRLPPALVLSEAPGMARALAAIRATWAVRDLINQPANLLGPAELAAQAVRMVAGCGVHTDVITGELLHASYPALAGVAAGSARPGHVVVMRWQGSGAGEASKLISLCGKGVCFDSGGYDLKPAAGMLRMKKDMAGAAVCLGLARMVMDADLPVRLVLRIGCVENLVQENAMRPLDILQTRRGLSVEVGNTDAEGRLVLCDLLAEASDENPDILIDFATLTGAARTALGPDMAAMFTNDDALATIFAESGRAEHDFVWRLPLWDGYNYWLESGVADLNNVSDKTHAGAIVAALFLQRFINAGTKWVHFDIYGWNDQAGPGRPAGGEVQGMRAAFKAISRIVHEEA